MQMKNTNKMSKRMKLKLKSKSKSKVFPTQLKAFKKSLQVGGLSGIPIDSVCEHQTIGKEIESNLPFFRLEDQKFLDELLSKQYPEYNVNLKGFELVDMSFEDSNSGGFQLGAESFESLLAHTFDKQTPSEINSAKTLVPVDFVDMWEKECSEEIKEVEEIVVKSQVSFVKIGISWADQLARSPPKVSCEKPKVSVKPKAHCLELRKPSTYSKPKMTKTADEKKKQSSLAWTVVRNGRKRKNYYANDYSSDREIYFTGDSDKFDFGFPLSYKY